MSAWEQYVEQAAAAIDPAAFDTADPIYAFRESRREHARKLGRAMLAVVGPLIAEDTRTRMVAAAARALEQEPHYPQCGTNALSINDLVATGSYDTPEPRYMETLDADERGGY